MAFCFRKEGTSFWQVEGFFLPFSVKYHREESVQVSPEKQQRQKPYAFCSPRVTQARQSISTEVSVFSTILLLARKTHIYFTSTTPAFQTKLKAFAFSYPRKLSWALLVIWLKMNSIAKFWNQSHTLLPLWMNVWQRQYNMPEFPFFSIWKIKNILWSDYGRFKAVEMLSSQLILSTLTWRQL